MLKVAINGMGRIGRAVFKIVLDSPWLALSAVNDLTPLDNVAYLLKVMCWYDNEWGYASHLVREAKGLVPRR